MALYSPSNESPNIPNPLLHRLHNRPLNFPVVWQWSKWNLAAVGAPHSWQPLDTKSSYISCVNPYSVSTEVHFLIRSFSLYAESCHLSLSLCLHLSWLACLHAFAISFCLLAYSGLLAFSCLS